jgi:tetraacyldisaccharide 4'-kinase
LLNASKFRDLVSGRRRGVGASALRSFLRLAEIPYSAAVGWRNRRYDRGANVHRAAVPVVSVGNLTLGGTGKTPMVEWLARWFHERGVRVALISRGYGARAGRFNDEALELRQKLPDLPHLLDADRVRAAEQAVRQMHCQLILLDDGFQHRRIFRDLDIVLVDALEPFGFDHVFPRGTLREPPSGLARAQAIVLTRADLVEAAARAKIREQITHYAPQALWIEATHAPQSLVAAGGETRSIDSLTGQVVAAFCGIGNPAAFRKTLERCGYHIAAFREFPDHHGYSLRDIDDLSAWADGLAAAAVVCTRKDLVKIACSRLAEKPLWALAIGLDVLAGREPFERLLSALSERAIQQFRESSQT